jgi:hypothetical protein
VSAIQLPHASAAQLITWLQPYATWPFTVLGTLSDGEDAIGVALRTCWGQAPHQLCQVHFLNNLAEPVLEVDQRFRQQLRQTLGDLPPVPDQVPPPPPLPVAAASPLSTYPAG